MKMDKWMRCALREELIDGVDGGGGGGGGDVETPWYASAGFSEEVLKDESVSGLLGKYKTPDEFAKGAASLSAKVGAKGIIPPGPDAGEEEIAQFYNQLGRPEAPDAYSWKPGEDLEIDEAILSERSKELHAAGLTDSQHAKVMDIYKGEMLRLNEAFQNHQAEIARESETALKSEWGKDYDSRIKSAAKVAEKYGVIDAFKESGLINNLGVIKLLDVLARSTREDGVDGNQGGGHATAEEQLAALKSHPGWNDKTHPEHRALVQRSVELRAKL